MQNDLRTPYMISQRYFMLTLLVAFFVHLSGFAVWTFTPKQEVQQMKIRMLNIRLGDGDELAIESPAVAVSANLPQVEAVVDKIVEAPAAPKQPQADGAKQYVREVNAPRPKNAGVKDGKRDAEIISRHTQVIALWIKKFLVYPPEIYTQKVQGNPTVRVRMDRRGNIRYYIIAHSTGNPQLDKAALDAVKRANPFPAAPDDYKPGDEILEFILPITFSITYDK